ncbi:hypothetical protein ACFVW9_39415 [Streptomyces sp. NPDC058217]|uniref:hypothetical protein n=1 Tax=Streptomyces sp. NPDC058217 TaxID=3346384 RepID=UPI0036F180F8
MASVRRSGRRFRRLTPRPRRASTRSCWAPSPEPTVAQLTLAGKLLYYFAKDTMPGAVKGQGVNDTWYASAPDGWKAGVKRLALGVLDHPKLGKILQDKNGRTLYLFTKDEPWR